MKVIGGDDGHLERVPNLVHVGILHQDWLDLVQGTAEYLLVGFSKVNG